MKNKISILHIDDDKVILEFSKKILTNEDINLYTANNVELGLEIYENKKPDIIILDISMPDSDGLQLAKEIKETNKDIKIIMMSGYDDKDKLLNAIELKVDKYLVKPVDVKEFKESIEKLSDEIKLQYKPKNLVFIKYGFVWDTENKILSKDNNEIKLTRKEIQFISLLSENEDKTYSSFDILNNVWEEDYTSDYNTAKIRGLLDRLKKKLKNNIFQSIYGVGYRLKLDK